jgi:hypothetical protein
VGLLGQLALRLGGARRTPPSDGARLPSTRFEHALRQYEDERHARILAVTPSSEPSPYGSRMPVGWRAQDVLGHPQSSGFVSIAEAARVMNVEEYEIVRQVRSGILEAHGKLVRPALVTALGVKDER